MIFTDILALIVVYIYVAVIFVVAEMVLKTRPEVSRKFLHIMVGNMIFAMPFFFRSVGNGLVFNTSYYNRSVLPD